ncbi:MAG: L-threonylcarbamoyladenylate synthase [Oscillospiraceae bacterium]|nr:L-threonylcarbamoyladenylate synthase [Oscillospiraceae bacterium]
MITEIIRIDEKNIDCPNEHSKLQSAAKLIRGGGLVVFPTETVYGLGANAMDAAAVKKIYETKGRPADNPLIVHLCDPGDIGRYAKLTGTADKLIKKFLPGPLTLVLEKKDSALDAACRLDTLALRVPKNKTARKLIELAGVPIAAPSANLSGRPSHTSPNRIIAELSGKVEAIICGENCEMGLESTVVSFNSDDSLDILRSGCITREMLSGYKIRESGSKEAALPPRSPGQKYAHYSPNAPLYMLSGDEERVADFVRAEMQTKRAGFLCHDEFLKYFADQSRIISLGKKNDAQNQAKNLFEALNAFNELDVELIYAIEPEKSGIGEAIYSRLIKAAGGKVIKI